MTIDQDNIQVEMVDGHRYSAADLALCGRVADHLAKHYPGHQWSTHLNSDRLGGVLIIRNLAHSSRWGYVLHLDKLHHDPGMKRVMQAGGEILERGDQARHRPWDGEDVPYIDGIPDKEQPFRGIVI